MKSVLIAFCCLLLCASPVFCSSPDSGSEFSSSGENRTPRSCSAIEWLDALALQQQRKPKRTSAGNRSVSHLFEKANDLSEFKDKLDNDREILRASAEALLEQKARTLEDELFVEWSEHWRDVCEKKREE